MIANDSTILSYIIEIILFCHMKWRIHYFVTYYGEVHVFYDNVKSNLTSRKVLNGRKSDSFFGVIMEI